MRHKVTLVMLCLLLWVGQVRAQSVIPVIDAANLTQNTTTALQQTLNTIEAVLQTGYMVLELTGIDELALDDEFFNDLDQLQTLVGEGQTIAWDLQSITQQIGRLFSLNSAPESSLDLYERQGQMREAILEAHTTAARVQTLIRTARHAVQHMKQFIDRIQAFEGNKQALQNINESTATLARLQATQHATTTAFERAATLQAMEAPVIQESIVRINQHFCGRWCR